MQRDEPERTRFTVTLVAPPGSTGIHELRALLKFAKRRFALSCIHAVEHHGAAGNAPVPTRAKDV
jgi:hypothetical protein